MCDNRKLPTGGEGLSGVAAEPGLKAMCARKRAYLGSCLYGSRLKSLFVASISPTSSTCVLAQSGGGGGRSSTCSGLVGWLPVCLCVDVSESPEC